MTTVMMMIIMLTIIIITVVVIIMITMIVIIITVVIIMITMIVIIITTVVAVRSFRTLMCAHVPSITDHSCMRHAPVKHLGAVQWNVALFQRRPCGYSFIASSRAKSETCCEDAHEYPPHGDIHVLKNIPHTGIFTF